MIAALALVGVLAANPWHPLLPLGPEQHTLRVYDVPPKVIKRVEPKMPKPQLEGSVILELEIDEKGRIVGGVVKKPMPFGYTEAAIEAVKQWKFKPARYRGRPKRVRYSVTVRFSPGTTAPAAPARPRRDKR